MTWKLALQWLPCQAPGVIGSALGPVSPVSVYCDWVRWKVWSATSISVWQHVKLSGQIRPWDTLACCWDFKQASNQHCLSISVHLYCTVSYFGLAFCNKLAHLLVRWFISALLIKLSFPPPPTPPPPPPRWPNGWGVRLGSGRSGVRIPLATRFCRVESYQWFRNWHSSGYSARRLALQGQCWDWSARCQYTVTRWGRKFDRVKMWQHLK